jgi:hypothetical protein
MTKASQTSKNNLKIGILLRGKYGKRAMEMIARRFDIVSYELPTNLPPVIDEPEEIVKSIPEEVLSANILISYALHPDINLEIIKLAAEKGARLVILPGGSKSGSRAQIKEVADRYGIRVLWEDICCATPYIEDEDISEFIEAYGMPEFEVEIEDGKIKEVRVKRGAICGSSFFVAERLEGISVEEAPSKAGYFTQIYPCYASRGIDGKIHRAANVHKRAIEKAIENAKDRRLKNSPNSDG